MERVDYVNTFITVAPDHPGGAAERPEPRRGGPTVASATYDLITAQPYGLTSGDVIFTVWADRAGVPDDDRARARAEFYAVPRACLRSSDLGKRFGWGVHADGEGRLALHPLGSPEYAALAAGRAPDGTPVTVRPAMRSRR